MSQLRTLPLARRRTGTTLGVAFEETGLESTLADLDARLALIEQRAPGLRAAGVRSLVIDGVTIRLLPASAWAEPPPSATPSALGSEPGKDLTNPLEDPDTFGGALPGFDVDPTLEPL